MRGLRRFNVVAWSASAGRISRAYARARRAVDTVPGGVLAGIGLALVPR